MAVFETKAVILLCYVLRQRTWRNQGMVWPLRDEEFLAMCNQTCRAVRWMHPVLKKVIVQLQCEAPKIAKLVYNSNNYGLWYSYWGL